jgi:hypothetical protein
MSSVIAFARRLSQHPDLSALFASGVFRYAWLEGVTEARLAHIGGAVDWSDGKAWTAGRLFGEKGEYRWETDSSGKIHAVVIMDTETPPVSWNEWFPLECEENADSDLILWGEWIDPFRDPVANPNGGPFFYAREIPIKCIFYPLDPDEARQDGQTPRLTIRRYRHKTEGEFIRCVGFRMKGEEEERTKREGQQEGES